MLVAGSAADILGDRESAVASRPALWRRVLMVPTVPMDTAMARLIMVTRPRITAVLMPTTLNRDTIVGLIAAIIGTGEIARDTVIGADCLTGMPRGLPLCARGIPALACHGLDGLGNSLAVQACRAMKRMNDALLVLRPNGLRPLQFGPTFGTCRRVFGYRV